jgi:hypothetical protein
VLPPPGEREKGQRGTKAQQQLLDPKDRRVEQESYKSIVCYGNNLLQIKF